MSVNAHVVESKSVHHRYYYAYKWVISESRYALVSVKESLCILYSIS